MHKYWTLHPSDSTIRSAKVFILSQIIYISESEKPVQQSMKANPNTRVMLNVYEYDLSTLTYTPAGRSALLNATNVLHLNVTDHVIGSTACKKFDHVAISQLSEYEPFHADLDLISRTDINIPTAISQDSNDPYIVERIIKKRYNSNKVQYEYFVKWQGYSSTENTWELPDNIPSDILEEYERTLLQAQSSEEEPRRSGLRDRSTRKITGKHDFILNM